jgi:hypothetical protein
MIPDPIDMGDEMFDAMDWNLLGLWFGAVATLLGAIGTVTAVFVAVTNRCGMVGELPPLRNDLCLH